MNQILSLIPVFPLLGFLIIGIFYAKIPKKITSIIGSGSILLSFIFSTIIFISLLNTNKPVEVLLFDWLKVGTFNIPFAFLADQLSGIMLMVVTGVGFLIHLYSVGYMAHDPGFNRFFAYMNLFVFFMLLLILGSNYVVMFIGWEGVGLSSYLLIGFWFKNAEYNYAARKAFIMNRIGDLGFLLGLFLMYQTFGSLIFKDVFNSALTYNGCNCTILLITLFLFIGAAGKSAQIPLYTWLPDAMAGPTPVSALIHAATMVTAGIYMIARSNILFAMSPVTLSIIAIVGICTALFAATIAIFQNDIKKVLAYSTVSQLGYMFVGLGVGAFTGAIFHLTTHAFFKALLFLGAGSVIHALGGEQDIRKMGGLKKYLPITYITFFIATLAIVGIPPLSGFFSKDEILAHAFEQNKLIWILGLIGAMFTSFYMFRLFFLTFYNKFRGGEEQEHHIHEHDKRMNIVLVILAGLALTGGILGLPEIIGGTHFLKNFLAPVFESGNNILAHHATINHETEILLIITAVTASLASIFFAYFKFVKKQEVPDENFETLKSATKIFKNKYYIDEIYDFLIVKPIIYLSERLHSVLEIKIIDRFVDFFGKSTLLLGNTVRVLQTGNTGFYLISMVISIILILVLNLIY